MRLRSTSSLVLSSLVVAGFTVVTSSSGCSSGSDRPDAGNIGTNVPVDGSRPEGSVDDDGGTEGGKGEAGTPKSCTNTIRDGKETDVDCGGSECPRCIDGKDCVSDNDCAGVSCSNKKCVTANCKDGITNGDETDVDCGGPVCSKCTIGKRCKLAPDCVSTTCGPDQACACPPSMAVVSKATGGAYCVDQVEITKGQYNKFINANVPIGDQKDACGPPAAGQLPRNETFIPRGAWPPAAAPGLPIGSVSFSLGLPVHYVDWCDAAAYCKWANKQLCGKINGGTLPQISANDHTQSAWYNACSAQGTKDWPYSTDYEASKCNGTGVGQPGIYDSTLNGSPPGRAFGFGGANQDTGVYQTVMSDTNGNILSLEEHHLGCAGGSLNLYQMSGNVAEWEDSCDGPDATSSCNLRGGSYAASGVDTTLRCDAARTQVRLPTTAGVLADVGFRCCLY